MSFFESTIKVVTRELQLIYKCNSIFFKTDDIHVKEMISATLSPQSPKRDERASL